MKKYFDGNFYGKTQKDNEGNIVQSQLEMEELSFDEIKNALKILLETKNDYELLDFILYDMFDLLNKDQLQTLIGQYQHEFRLLFHDKIQAKDEQLAEYIKNNEI